MADSLTSQKRSWNMSRIKSKNTAPEVAVRKVLYGMGYRYRLHNADIPGKPDIVLKKLMSVIFVHGCFWHRHPGCKFAYTPKTREEFWNNKFGVNVQRDKIVEKQLSEAGWRRLTIWECETKDKKIVEGLLRNFLAAGT